MELEIQNSLKWYREEVEVETAHIRDLSVDEKYMIINGLAQLQDEEISWASHTPKNPLFGELQSLFDEILNALTTKRGFILIKGLPDGGSEYSSERIKKLLLELSLYLGRPLTQNKNQDLIFDVKSIEGFTLDKENSRGPYVKEALPMHTDAGAILGMYCISAANKGGLTLLSSARTVHDEIKSISPDLLEVLYQPFYIDRRGHELEGALPYDLSPVFAMYDNQLVCQYHQPFCTDAHKKFPHLPPLTKPQIEAMVLFDSIATRKDIVYEIKVEPGNLIFINNENILHGRTSFDYSENRTVRHLLRIWLNTPLIKNTFPNYLGYPFKIE